MAIPVRADLDLGGIAKVKGLAAPVDPDDAVRKADLDAIAAGLSWHESCRVATTANINLSAPGSTIDGVTLVAGDRVLVKDQTDQSQNGIYVWNGASTPMSRASDADTADELEAAVVTIEEGTQNKGTSWRQDSVNFTLGTDPVVWVAFGAAAPPATETTAGVAEIATQAEVDAGTDDQRIVTPLKLANWAGRVKKYVATIGDGTNTQYTVTHNLGTQDVQVVLYEANAPYAELMAEVRHTSSTQVTILFASAPASGSVKVVVLG